MKNQKGVSLIALVITIIVVIILAAIAFNSSTSTIEKANYSKFVSNIGEVRDAFKRASTEFKGDEAAKGNEITDAQAYDYVAKGAGTANHLTGSGDEILPLKDVPSYTVIRKESAKESIGIDLPVIKVNTPTATNVEVTFATTASGDVFVWPPYKYDGEYYVNDTTKLTGVSSTNTTAKSAQDTGFLGIKLDKDGDAAVTVDGGLKTSNQKAGLSF